MVLGSMKTAEYWGFAANGKHPAAKDYLRTGQSSPLMEGFVRWVEEGYSAISASKKKAGGRSYAWRFWARGGKKDALVCGVVKDSSDGLGRLYPLLIMGTGPLPGWEDTWELLPFACEETWSQIEFLSAHTFDEFGKLEKGISNIRQPESDWPALQIVRKKQEKAGEMPGHPTASSWDAEGREPRASGLKEKTEVYISLDHSSSQDLSILISNWHHLFKTHVKAVPSATFIGGTLEKSYVAFFRRPLVSADFIRLWSIDCAEVRSDGSCITG